MSANLGGLYIGIGYIFDNNWEICVRPLGAELGNVDFLEYKFVLDLHCQQLGNMCHLEGVCATFGRGFWECEFLEYTFVLDLHCQQLGNMCQLEGVYAPFGRGLGECAFSRIYICAIFRSKICLFAIFSCFSISVRGLNLPVPNLPWANLRGANMLGKRQIGHWKVRGLICRVWDLFYPWLGLQDPQHPR